MSRFIPPPTVSALNTWAAQKRSLYLDEEQPLASVLGQLKKDRNAAGALRQKWPEVYAGDGLTVELIIRTLTELPRLTVTYYYVLRWPWRVPIADQARDLGIKTRDFWRHLELAEATVDSGLQLLKSTDDVRTLRKPVNA